MMRRYVLVVVVVTVVVAAFAGYMLRRSPAPVSGGEPAGLVPDIDIEAHAIVARIKEQEALTASTVAEVPTAVSVPPAAPVVVESGMVPPGLDPNEQAELRAIDAYAAAERQKIETWYADEVAELKASLEWRMQHLDEGDKPAWAQFYQRANETWSTTSGYDSGSSHDYGYEYSHGSGRRSETTKTYAVGDPAGDYAAIMAQIKDSRQATQEDFAKAQERLAWLRGHKLADVQTEVSRRKAAITSQKSRAETEAAREQAGDPTPRIEAIMGGPDGRFMALIGDGFVSAGDMVQGYRVKEIQAGSVEFEKDGQTWVQKVD